MNWSVLLKEKDKEIRELVKRAKTITKAAGNSPSKEALKERCLKHERSIDNLQGRLKNISGTMKENPANAKMEQTIRHQILEIDAIKESMATLESTIAKLRRKIPCEAKPCPVGEKKCPYSHRLEYKSQQNTYKKQLLCKYFAGRGCHLADEDCQFSHSLELLAKEEEFRRSAGTGANNMPLGKRDSSYSSFNDTEGTSNLANQRFRKVTQTANNNVSVEVLEDLRRYPENDARRTLNRKRSRSGEARWPRQGEVSGNGQGTSSWRSHKEDPRAELRPQQSQPKYPIKRPRSPSFNLDRREERPRNGDRSQQETRRNYEREDWDNNTRGARGYRQRGQRRRY